MKKMISKSALMMAVAAGLMFTACGQKEPAPEVNGLSGKVTTVNMAVSVKDNATRNTAAGVGYDQMPALNSIFVVPMALTSTPQAAVDLTKVGANQAATDEKAKEINLDENTDRFLVYVNVEADKFKDGAVPTGFGAMTFVPTKLTGDKAEYYAPYPLYMFADSKVNQGYLYKEAEKWVNGAEVDWTRATDEIANHKPATATNKLCIKVDKVNYAVGSMALMVKNGYVADKEKTYAIVASATKAATDAEIAALFTAEDADIMTADEWAGYVTGDAPQITMTGVMVNNQPNALNSVFDHVDGATAINIYDPVMNNNKVHVSTATAAFDENLKTAANSFVVVAKEVASKDPLTVNIEFKYAATTPNTYIYFRIPTIDEATGKEVYTYKTLADGATFYLGTRLANRTTTVTDVESSTFAADYTTLVNANVVSWYKFTTKPQTSVNADFGVEVDIDWQNGHVYTEEI